MIEITFQGSASNPINGILFVGGRLTQRFGAVTPVSNWRNGGSQKVTTQRFVGWKRYDTADWKLRYFSGEDEREV